MIEKKKKKKKKEEKKHLPLIRTNLDKHRKLWELLMRFLFWCTEQLSLACNHEHATSSFPARVRSWTSGGCTDEVLSWFGCWRKVEVFSRGWMEVRRFFLAYIIHYKWGCEPSSICSSLRSTYTSMKRASRWWSGLRVLPFLWLDNMREISNFGMDWRSKSSARFYYEYHLGKPDKRQVAKNDTG